MKPVRSMQTPVLSLRAIGVILILVPFVVAALFITVLNGLLHGAQESVAHEQHNEQLLYESRRIPALFKDAATLMSGYMLTSNKSLLSKSLSFEKQISQHLVTLDDLTKGSQLASEHTSRISDIIKDGLISLANVRELAEHGDRQSPTFVTQVLKRYDCLQAAERGLIFEFDQLVEEGKQAQTEAIDARLIKQWLSLTIVSGLLLSLISTLLLAQFFRKILVDRLGVLIENSIRLANGSPLLEQLPGNDEIAVLDKVFHQVAISLRDASRKEKAIIANTADVIACLNEDGTFALVSAASRSAWGYAPEELNGRHYREIIAEDDRTGTESNLEQAMRLKRTIAFENRVERKDHKLVDTFWNTHWSESEKLFICVAHDISQRKQLARMEQEFLSIVSHDLRTPLTSIGASLTLLSQGILGDMDERAIHELHKLEEQSKRLFKLASDLLETQKFQEGKMSLSFEEVDIDDLVDQSIFGVNRLAEENCVDIRSTCAELQIVCDPDRIIQVITNLISNAIKFSPRGAQVLVEMEDLGQSVEVRVVDSGPGVPPGFEESIFERYNQAPDTKKGGFGLGLAICKMMIDAHHGQIGMRPREGGGATFWFRLPVGEQPAD